MNFLFKLFKNKYININLIKIFCFVFISPVISQEIYGIWYRDEITEIKFLKTDNNTIKVTGYAQWQGLNDDQGNTIIHDGSFSGIIYSNDIKNNKFKIEQSGGGQDCIVNFQIFKNYIEVKDNHDCGGMNVNFDGKYFKK